MKKLQGLYVITDTALTPWPRLVDAVTDAIDGGAAAVQYRDKHGSPEQRLREAGALCEVCRSRGVPLIINDDVALCRSVGADGVHIGKDDESLGQARSVLGPDSLIGVSCYASLDPALTAQAAGADYVAFGSFFPSPTKPQAVRAERALLVQAQARISIPIVAIGGITPENGAQLIEAGADMVAVITGVFDRDDVRAAAARYARLFASAS